MKSREAIVAYLACTACVAVAYMACMACVVCIKSELRHSERLEIVLISKEVVELVLVIVANRRDVEEPEIVLKRDPEAAVIFID